LKNGQKLKLGDSHVTPRNTQEVQASKLGDAPEAPLLHRQKSGHLSTHYIFIASCTMRFSWSISCFSFQFSFVLFSAINSWTPTNFFWRSCLAFHLPRTLCFSLLSFQRVFSFSATAFSFHFFALICVQILLYLYIKVYYDLWSMLVFIKRVVLKKVRMVLEKRKSFMQKSGTKRSLCRLQPRHLHVVLDVFLIVCLVVLL
jgi:hypothetical protein